MAEVAASSRPAERFPEMRWIGLIALTVLFGVQSLRALMPLVVFVLRDRFGWPAVGVGLLVLSLLATGFLVVPARRAAGTGRFLLIAAGGLGLARLALQLWTGDPLVDLGLAITAAVLFFFVLPALPAADLGAGGNGCFISGWLIGLAADSALHGAYGTWDMSLRSDSATLVIIVALAAVQWRLLAVAIRLDGGGQMGRAGHPPSTWAALGPLLLLELLVLGNVARLTTLTGWGQEWGALWVVAGRILAVVAVVPVARGGRLAPPVSVLPPMSVLLASALAASFVVPWPRGIWAAGQQMAGVVLAAVLWASISGTAARRRTAAGSVSPGSVSPGSVSPGSVSPGSVSPGSVSPGSGGGRPRRLAVSHGFGLLSFGVLFFLYYAGVDLHLPFSKDLLPPIAALAVGAAAVAAARRGADIGVEPARRRAPARKVSLKGGMLGALAATALLALPAVKFLLGPEVDAGAGGGFPLRIMTYNLHLCIDPLGRLDLEQIAATIEAEHPDLVALQEVSRGWVIGGSVDTLAWLSRRLGMSYVFAATADPLWGNAILSRRPLLDHQALALPSEDLLIQRGFLAARVDLGEDGHFEAVVTHHHHRQGGGKTRERQSRALLDYWQGRERTVIMGDFNGRPGEPEIEMMARAGLGDVLELAGVEPGLTYPALGPDRRIDYIWISPDLVAREVSVPPSPASDHLPVVATLDLRPGD